MTSLRAYGAFLELRAELFHHTIFLLGTLHFISMQNRKIFLDIISPKKKQKLCNHRLGDQICCEVIKYLIYNSFIDGQGLSPFQTGQGKGTLAAN
jgi:hypothetical protein